MKKLHGNNKHPGRDQGKIRISKAVDYHKQGIKNPVMVNKLYIYGIIVLFTFLIYGNSIFHEYALDDKIIITENKFTQKGINGIKDIFSYDSFKGFGDNMLNGLSGGRYRPLSIASFAVECQFFGKAPHFSHFINVLIYALTCIIIFVLLSKLPLSFPQKEWHKSFPFIATLLFIAHPVHTEVVDNIKCRDELFAFMFSLLSFWFICRFLSRGRFVNLFYSCIMFILALFSKENALVFILIFPVTLYFFSNYSLKKILSSSLAFVVIGISFLIFRNMIISGTGITPVNTRDIMNDSFAGMNIYQKYATIVYTFGIYLKLLFFPHPLTWDYYPYHIGIMEWKNIKVILSLLTYLFLVCILFKGLRKKSIYSYCILFFLISVSITSNIFFPVGAFLSERFLYIGSLAFCVLLAYIITVRQNKMPWRIFKRPYLFLIPVLFLFSFKTITRNEAWKDGTTLVANDIKTSFNSLQSNYARGTDLYYQADSCKDVSRKNEYYELALGYCLKAYQISPGMQLVNLTLGNIYLKYKNDLERSIFHLSNAMNSGLKNIGLYNNLGMAYGMSKQYDKAIDIFNKALEISPDDVTVLNNIALTYRIAGNIPKADEYSGRAAVAGEKKKNR